MEEIEEQDDRECDDDRGEPEAEDVADIVAGHCRPGRDFVQHHGRLAAILARLDRD
jgi:hypothetical protein